jgi:Cof subfamily protein (haloacid dehalogenase superfamily)
MDYKIVFFDIDGTLFNEDKEIPKSTIDAINQLKSTGVELVIATGRAPYFRSITE